MQWELTKRLAGSLLGVRWGLAEGIEGLSGVCWKFAEGIESLLGVCQEFVKGDRELARMVSGVRRKKTKKLARRSSGVVENLTGMSGGCATVTQESGQQAVVVPPRLVIVPSPPRNPSSKRRLDCPDRRLYRPYPIFKVAFDDCTTHT
ncbi:hypothetical protein BHM03_00050027 [Ensete ventricosum]|nr:hypothetical protein BHM03_00050027 [Ensete ventricosum]